MYACFGALFPEVESFLRTCMKELFPNIQAPRLALAAGLVFSMLGTAPGLLTRIQHRCRWTATRFLCGRFVRPRNTGPLISFTFDDFPQSALLRGGAILKSFGATGTYYASLGFIGRDMGEHKGDHMPVGKMFSHKDLGHLLAEGHELGCHTFGHCHSWSTSPAAFEQSILENMSALHRISDGASFRTFSYPVSGPRPETKKRVARHFMCCRGGEQGFNAGRTDLNYLNAYFLRDGAADSEAIKALIDQNCRQKGWLIFATHDVSPSPTAFGCNPHVFEEIVRYALASGSSILPVAEACELFVTGRPQKDQFTPLPEHTSRCSSRAIRQPSARPSVSRF